MKILIIGAGGMVGRKLTVKLQGAGALNGQPITALTLADIFAPEVPQGGIKTTSVAADLSRDGAAEELLAERPDVIFHLAAIVSGEAEANFEKGYRINLDGTRLLFEAIRQAGQVEHYYPKLVFTSSIAVFGEPLPAVIPDTQVLTPLTSYGTQKAIGELLLADYSRRGVFDGIGIRLPTIAVRPGAPNKAASGFFSGIIREPLAGLEAILPVAETVRHWFASPRAAVGFLIHAAELNTATLGQRRSLSMPGLSATVGEQIEALERAAGLDAVALIRREPDAKIIEMVAGWPKDFDSQRATDLGFVGDSDIDEIIRIHIADELKGKIGRGAA
ncbi:SDR family oxidoreductase [Devosia rhodophyticola]|uniref:SDR family oxidoreductase n=1 Tax=Devosia rhodophyticola TaxID=3026423 RepID=A0ABY7YU92_9HYPH|nr:D-erythronate dehydrogenase [Devosia rhodophyticola]WDR04938.1 SDR family oxidoreductase [Devosia rhodophyticola]